jgi:glycosyltransferase involved in cell wall biosynthesis
MHEVLVASENQFRIPSLPHDVCSFDEVAPDRLRSYGRVMFLPGKGNTPQVCEAAFEWKREGLLPDTRLFLGTYGGRHLWSPDNDSLVERWVVHASSERLVLDSDRLVFVPLCRDPLPQPAPRGDEGYVFMGGRKWREIDVGLAAIVASGFPGRVITDIAPDHEVSDVQVTRERVGRDEYLDAMCRARMVLIPLKQIPISHGHTDVVNAILAGRPVLVTAGSSCDDYVRHGVNGLLVADNSVSAWTQAIHEAHARAEELAAGAREMAPRYLTIAIPAISRGARGPGSPPHPADRWAARGAQPP